MPSSPSPPSKRQKLQHHPVAVARQRPSQSPLALLLSLPRELRDLIYHHYGLDWNDINHAVRTLERNVESWHSEASHGSRPTWPPTTEPDIVAPCRLSIKSRSTPTLLLLCRQVTDEAREILTRKPLIIGPHVSFVPAELWPLQVTAFISSTTLQQVRHLVLDPDGRGRPWHYTRGLDGQSYEYIGIHVRYERDMDFSGREAFQRREREDLRQWLWGLRNALRSSQALQTLTVQFRQQHTFEMRKLYYAVMFDELARHLPPVDIRLPEDDDDAESLLCDMLADSTRSRDFYASWSAPPLR